MTTEGDDVETEPAPEIVLADAKALRRAFGEFATGVTVVTVGGPTPHGMTANAFTSVSLDPPLLLVCVGRNATMHGYLEAAGAFGVSVLAEDQEPVASHFADRWRPAGRAQFDPVDWVPGTVVDVPLIVGAVARFECELWTTYDGGDHTIFIGKLVAAERPAGRNALLFHGGAFRTVGAASTTA